ncbi:hypothetical protein GCM10007967_11750 [Xylanimonas ulmi]
MAVNQSSAAAGAETCCSGMPRPGIGRAGWGAEAANGDVGPSGRAMRRTAETRRTGAGAVADGLAVEAGAGVAGDVAGGGGTGVAAAGAGGTGVNGAVGMSSLLGGRLVASGVGVVTSGSGTGGGGGGGGTGPGTFGLDIRRSLRAQTGAFMAGRSSEGARDRSPQNGTFPMVSRNRWPVPARPGVSSGRAP